jgi:outer membrane protein assembly factor BamB
MSVSNWWMYHGDHGHTGMVTGSNLNSRTVAGLKLLYDVPIPGPVLSVPAVVDGFVYGGLANVHNDSGSNGGTFLKIALATGEITAKYEWTIDPAEGDSHGFMGMGCTPAVRHGKVYFTAFNGTLYCLNQTDLRPVWITDLRNADLAHNQPVSNTPGEPGFPLAAGWSSPVVGDKHVYVGIGEGENPGLFGFVFALDRETGNVVWIYCTCQFEDGVPNQPNVLPPGTIKGPLPPPFTLGPGDPRIRGCSVWSSIAFDARLNRLYCATGNPVPDSTLPTKGFSNGILSLDAMTGAFRGFFQALPESSYRSTDNDVDFGGSPILFTVDGRRLVAAGCKNGGLFVLDAETLELVRWRQLLPYYNDGTQIPSVDPHIGPQNRLQNLMDPEIPNILSDEVDQENYSGTYSTPAVNSNMGRLFIGIGGNNYHPIKAGIDYSTTPFLRALDWDTLEDAWEMDDSDPRLYIHAQPPMYRTPGESGLSSPASVNDVVFCATSKIAIYAFHAYTGKMLWEDQLGIQTGGMNGGYGYCLGPAVSGDYVVAGALVFGCQGGVLRIYGLPPAGA